MKLYGWMHIQCVNWIPDLYFEEGSEVEINDKPKFNKKKCTICDKNCGRTLKCDFDRCQEYFHVRCAVNKSIISDWQTMEKF